MENIPFTQVTGKPEIVQDAGPVPPTLESPVEEIADPGANREPVCGIYLARGGRWYRLGPDQIETWVEARRPGELPSDLQTISRAVWDGAFSHPAVSLSREAQAEELLRLETVQTINSPDWSAERDDLDWAIKSNVIEVLREKGYDAEADRMTWCGTVIGRRRCLDCGTDAPIERMMCGQYHLCPACARVRANEQRKELEKDIGQVQKKRGYRWKMLTLPVKTDGAFKEALQQVNKAFATLWRDVLTYQWRKLDEEQAAQVRERKGRYFLGRQRVFPGDTGYWRRQDAEGQAAFKSLEFGEKTGNVHAHVLLFSAYIPKDVIEHEWERLTGSYVIDLQQVRPRPGDGELAISDAITETVKYVTKMSAASAERQVELWEALRGRRTSEKYGQLRDGHAETFENEWHCDHCGGARFLWLYVPADVALSEHMLRGPPAERIASCESEEDLARLTDELAEVQRIGRLPASWLERRVEEVVEHSRTLD